MLCETLQPETLNPEVRNYIRELETDNKRIIELETYKNKYLELKERYDLLIYKRFCRSTEELADDKQQSLFVEEAEQTKAVEEEEPEKQEIKSYTRKKPGRKPLAPNLRRVEQIIDIPEEEKNMRLRREND